jgi:O-antigen/teichoic acid export membrane protein
MKNESFLRSVIVLASGSGLAQVLTVLASPVLTRLYAPEDFGLFAVVMAIVASLLSGASGRYETAMVLPKADSHGVHLLGIAIFFAAGFCSLLLALTVFGKDYIVMFLNVSEMGDWILLTPIVLFAVSMSEIFSFFASRHKKFSEIGRAAIVRALSIIMVNVMLGLYGAKFTGLLIGNLVGYSLAAAYLFYVQRGYIGREVFKLSPRKKVLTIRHIDYPLYNASSGILNGIRFNMPIFFLIHFFPESVVGFYALLTRVAYVPLVFIAKAVSHVNLRRIVDLVNSGSAVTPYIHRVTLWLLVIATAPAIVFVLWAPDLFEWIFGDGWHVAGEYLQIVTPAVVAWFVVTSLSLTLDATKNNKPGATWKTTAFISTFLVYMWFSPRGDIIELLIAHAVNDVLLYAFYYILILRAAKDPKTFARC